MISLPRACDGSASRNESIRKSLTASARCCVGLRACALGLRHVALVRDALRLQVGRDGEADEHREEAGREPDCEAVAPEELAGAIVPRIGAREHRHAVQIALHVGRELLDRGIAPLRLPCASPSARCCRDRRASSRRSRAGLVPRCLRDRRPQSSRACDDRARRRRRALRRSRARARRDGCPCSVNGLQPHSSSYNSTPST